MIQKEEVIALIRQQIPDAEVMIEDKTGMSDHFILKVASKAFAEVGTMDRHRMVMDSLEAAMKDGRLHAAEIKTIPLQ